VEGQFQTDALPDRGFIRGATTELGAVIFHVSKRGDGRHPPDNNEVDGTTAINRVVSRSRSRAAGRAGSDLIAYRRRQRRIDLDWRQSVLAPDRLDSRASCRSDDHEHKRNGSRKHAQEAERLRGWCAEHHPGSRCGGNRKCRS
jgi:hypothetical protein